MQERNNLIQVKPEGKRFHKQWKNPLFTDLPNDLLTCVERPYGMANSQYHVAKMG